MKSTFILVISIFVSPALGSQEPLSTPVFMKLGFSSIVEFDESPTEVVLGNSNAFQVEKLKNSLVLRSLVHSASTNAFVYFKHSDPKLLVLTVSDKVNPTYYLRLASLKPMEVRLKQPTTPRKNKANTVVGIHINDVHFRDPHDYLIVDLSITADSKGETNPQWAGAKLNFQGRSIPAGKVWSSRREIMRDSSINARIVFVKPDIPPDFAGVSLMVPLIKGDALVSKLKEVR